MLDRYQKVDDNKNPAVPKLITLVRVGCAGKIFKQKFYQY